MIKHVGFPVCVSNDPFKLVHTPAELRQWKAANPKKEDKPKKESK